MSTQVDARGFPCSEPLANLRHPLLAATALHQSPASQDRCCRQVNQEPLIGSESLEFLGQLKGLGYIPAVLMEDCDQIAACGPGWRDDPARGPARGPPGPSAKPARDSRASKVSGPHSPWRTRTGHGRHRERHASRADGGHSRRSPAPGVSLRSPNLRGRHGPVPARECACRRRPGSCAPAPGQATALPDSVPSGFPRARCGRGHIPHNAGKRAGDSPSSRHRTCARV